MKIQQNCVIFTRFYLELLIFLLIEVELVEAVAEKTGLTKADTTRAIDATFATIVEALSKGSRLAFFTLLDIFSKEKGLLSLLLLFINSFF